jgi:hypothetical protein
VISFIPNANININGNHEPRAALIFGAVTMLVGLVLIAIPAIAAFVTLRKKKHTLPANFNEPIPPAN